MTKELMTKELMTEKLMARKRARDSENGRFIPLEEAKRRPKETTVETVRKPICPKSTGK